MPTWTGGSGSGANWVTPAFVSGQNYRGRGRFTNVTIPTDAIISSATLAVRGRRLGGTNRTLNLGLFELDTHTGTLSTTSPAGDAPTAYTGTLAAPYVTHSANVATQLQAIVNRPGWAAGNSIVAGMLILQDGGEWQAVSGSNMATLVVEYIDSTDYTREASDEALAVDEVTTAAGWLREAADSAAPVDQATTLMPIIAAAADSITPVDAAQATLIEGIPVVVGDVVDPVDQVAVSTVAFEPPPPPWETVVASPEYLEASRSLHRESDWRAEIISPDGVIGGDIPLVTGQGQVVVDGERAYWWSTDLSCADQAFYPHHETDPLHPHSRHSFQLWYRLYIPRISEWVEVPCGRYYPRVGDLTADADKEPLGFGLMGVSAFGTIRHYLQPVDVGGLRAHTAIETILSAVAPTIPRDLTPSRYSVPSGLVVGEPHAGDPVADMHSIAKSAGMILYEDRVGTIRLIDTPDAIPDWDWTDVVQALTVRPTDVAETVNSVLVTSESDDVDPPVWAIAQITGTEDPISVDYGVYYPLHIGSGIVTTEAQAGTYAANELIRRRESVREIDMVTVPQVHVDPFQVVTLDRAEQDAVGPHRVTGWTLTMSPLALMGALARGAVESV